MAKQPGKAQADMCMEMMKLIRCGGKKNDIIRAMLNEHKYSIYTTEKAYRKAEKKHLEIEAELTENTEYNRRKLSGPVHKRALRFHTQALQEMDDAQEHENPEDSAKAWGRAQGLSSSALNHEQTLAKWHHLEHIAPALEMESEPTREYLTESLVRHFGLFSTVSILKLMEAGQRVLESRPDAAERTRRHMANDRSFARFLYNTYENARGFVDPPPWDTPPDDDPETSH